MRDWFGDDNFQNIIEINLPQDCSDADLAHLKGLTKLQTLDLWGTSVTDAGLAHLNGLTKLQRLVLRDTQVSDAVIEKLQKALPRCRIFK